MDVHLLDDILYLNLLKVIYALLTVSYDHLYSSNKSLYMISEHYQINYVQV